MKALMLILLLSSASANAGEVQDLMDRCHETLRGQTQWNWTVVRVRAILELGIKVPVLASFSVNPEVELYFTRQ